MKRFNGLATVGVVAVLGAGIGAAEASAYSISGGPYTGTGPGSRLTFSAGHVFTCPSVYSGVATGADTTSITPAIGPSCGYLGLPAAGAHSGAWSLKVVAGPDGGGYYDGELSIPPGATTTASVPMLGCTGSFSGPQLFRHGFGGTVIRLRNVGADATLEMNLNGITYSATGTCFSSGTGGNYATLSVVTLPGVTIS
jgi:hypothetical protein